MKKIVFSSEDMQEVVQHYLNTVMLAKAHGLEVTSFRADGMNYCADVKKGEKNDTGGEGQSSS